MRPDLWDRLPEDAQQEMREAEEAALATFASLGVPVEDVTDYPNANGCEGCDFHGFVNGEQVDGGRATSLLYWHTEDYITLTSLRRVVPRPAQG